MFAALVPSTEATEQIKQLEHNELDEDSVHELPQFQPNSERLQLVGMMVAAGCLSGVVSLAYDWCMSTALHLTWKSLPHYLTDAGLFSGALANYAWLYTIAAATVMAALAGAAIRLLGFPGDLPNVVECIHKVGYVPLRQAPPMFACSILSIAAGGSLGPEAPLVAICSAVCGFAALRLGQSPDMVRKFTLMGECSAVLMIWSVAQSRCLHIADVDLCSLSLNSWWACH